MGEHGAKCSIAGCGNAASIAVDVFSESDGKTVTLYMCGGHFRALVEKAYRRGYLSTLDLVAKRVDGGYRIRVRKRANRPREGVAPVPKGLPL